MKTWRLNKNCNVDLYRITCACGEVHRLRLEDGPKPKRLTSRTLAKYLLGPPPGRMKKAPKGLTSIPPVPSS
jgi:hypothetical protein